MTARDLEASIRRLTRLLDGAPDACVRIEQLIADLELERARVESLRSRAYHLSARVGRFENLAEWYRQDLRASRWHYRVSCALLALLTLTWTFGVAALAAVGVAH